jgi:sugar lactone lactonase YvrE
VRIVGKKKLREPEAITFDRKGRLYTSCIDGTIRRLDPKDPEKIELYAFTGGRPLGMGFAPDGTLYVADAIRGLLAFSRGQKQILVERFRGEKLLFVNNLALDWPARQIYFTVSSRLIGFEDEHRLDIVSGRATGRLFRYDLRTKKLSLLLDHLYFANGVVLSKDRSFLLVAETARYRILKYPLKKRGEVKPEIFAENLPGFPDNLSLRPDGGLWVALASARVPILDTIHPYVFIKRLLFALPSWMRPAARRYGFVIRLDPKGKIVESLQDPRGKRLANVTHAVESQGTLYLGQIYNHARGLGFLPYPAK